MPPASASSKNNGRISDWEAGVSLAKAIMGAGSFALPWAFSKMGYVAGPIFMTVFLGLSVHSIGLLADCACWLRKQRRQRGGGDGSQPLTYVEVARSAFGPVGATLSYLTGISASIGVCGSYLVFVAVNLESLLWSSSSSSSASASSSSSIVSSGEESSSPPAEQGRIPFLIWTVVLPIAVLLSSVRDPKRFAAVSFWGDVSVVAGMLAVLVYGIADAATATATSGGDSSNGGNKIGDNGCVAVGSPENMALAFGSIGYLFLVHFLVLPIESNMVAAFDSSSTPSSSRSGENRRFEERDRFRDREPRCHPSPRTARPGTDDAPANEFGDHKKRFRRVVLRTFAVCGGIGGFFGIAGYLLFGADTREIVLLNVRGGIGMTVVRFLLCVDLVLTYPVVMRPSIGILEQQWSVFARRRRQLHAPSGGDSPVPSARMVTTPLDNNNNNNNPRAIASPSSRNQRNATLGGLEIDGGGIASAIATHDGNDGAVPALVDRKTHAAVCVGLGCIAAGAATFVPAFGLLSGLVGGVSQTFLAFVLPPLMWAKQREGLLGGRGKRDSSIEDDCFGAGHQNRNKNPGDATTTTSTGWSFLRVLPWRERGLVLCGFGLVVWTLRSTWAELGGGGD